MDFGEQQIDNGYHWNEFNLLELATHQQMLEENL